MTPRLLDLFCGAGGAAVGYHRAGFTVVGVDIAPQPHYPYEFHQADAMTFPLDGFDVIHASPPCQAYTTMNNRHPSTSPPLIGLTLARLRAQATPWVVENVTGARQHMPNAILLHGGMFGLDLFRPRLFVSSHLLMLPPKTPRPAEAAAIYGTNNGRRLWTRVDGTHLRAATLQRARLAMEMPWADWDGLREAIPPAYTEHIGRQLIDHLVEAAA